MVAKWILVGFFVFGALATIGNVGKVRKPTTPGVAAIATLINAACIVAIIIWWRS